MMVHLVSLPVVDGPIKYLVHLAQQAKPKLLAPDALVQAMSLMVKILVLLKITLLQVRTIPQCISPIWAHNLSMLWQLGQIVLLLVQCRQRIVIKNLHPVPRNRLITQRTEQEAGFVTEACNSDVFSGGITEKDFAQFSNSFTHTKPNSSGRCSLPAPKTPTNGSDINCIKGSSISRGDVSFTNGSFVNRPIDNNEPNVARFDFR